MPEKMCAVEIAATGVLLDGGEEMALVDAMRDTILQRFGGDHHDAAMGWCPVCKEGVKAMTIRQR